MSSSGIIYYEFLVYIYTIYDYQNLHILADFRSRSIADIDSNPKEDTRHAARKPRTYITGFDRPCPSDASDNEMEITTLTQI
jgi:lysyl-tRNA synthetase class I